MKGGLGNIMKQAQQMQENMARAQEELANLKVHGESGGGLVKVVMTCRYGVTAVMRHESVRKYCSGNNQNCRPGQRNVWL